MQMIKRVKGGNTHFVQTIGTGSRIVALTTDPAKALQIDDSEEGKKLAGKFVARHKGVTTVGVLTFEPGGIPINDAAKVLAEEKARKEAEAASIDALRAKASRFDAAEAARVAAEKALADIRSSLAADHREKCEAASSQAREQERGVIADFLLNFGAEKDAEWLMDLVDSIRTGKMQALPNGMTFLPSDEAGSAAPAPSQSTPAEPTRKKRGH